MANSLIRPFVWLRRFRNRCGYGVHSPFAFQLITEVFYEKAPYYAYRDLAVRERQEGTAGWRKAERLKVKRLLFRLVNRVQPATVVHAGIPTSASLYLQAGCLKQDFRMFRSVEELGRSVPAKVDFAYLCHPGNPEFVWNAFNLLADRVSGNSVFAVSGIGTSAAMRRLWRDIQQDERSGISFDLYDLGVVFFDKTRIKQHYVVNF